MRRRRSTSGSRRAFDTPDDVRLDGDAGAQFQAAWDEVADPWFNFTSGNGFYHFDEIWIEHPEMPYAFIKRLHREDRGRRDDRAPDRCDPSPSVTASSSEYRDLLATHEDREVFDGKLGLARVVFPYVENHDFYIEHWTMGVVWRKIRDLGATLTRKAFGRPSDDLLYLSRNEVDEVLWDYGQHLGPVTLPRRRRRTGRRSSSAAGTSIAKLKGWSAPQRRSVSHPRSSPSRSRSCSGGSRPTR